MTKARQRFRAKKRSLSKPNIPPLKVIEAWVVELATDLRKEEKFVTEVFVDCRTEKLFQENFKCQIVEPAPCKGIKLNGDKQVSAIFYDKENKTDFVGTFYERDDGSIESYTMELNRMGKYSRKPIRMAINVDKFIWEMEHWLAGLFAYLEKEQISLEWSTLSSKWREWTTLSDVEKTMAHPITIHRRLK